MKIPVYQIVQNIVKIPVFQIVQIIVKISVYQVQEECEGSRVPEAYVYTQDRDLFRPLKRRVEVSLRDLSREDRDAFNRAEQKRVGFVA